MPITEPKKVVIILEKYLKVSAIKQKFLNNPEILIIGDGEENMAIPR